MSIQQNLEHILSRIRAAELRAGRPAGSVRLVAVSKTFPAEDVKACHDAGQRIFGENKVQEGLAKIPSLPPDTEWHLIGPLQRNKVRKALEYFTLIMPWTPCAWPGSWIPWLRKRENGPAFCWK